MKSTALVLTIASLMASTSAFADEASAQRESNLQVTNFQVAAAPSAPKREANTSTIASDTAKRGETSNPQPDPAFMPYVNGGYYDSK